MYCSRYTMNNKNGIRVHSKNSHIKQSEVAEIGRAHV